MGFAFGDPPSDGTVMCELDKGLEAGRPEEWTAVTIGQRDSAERRGWLRDSTSADVEKEDDFLTPASVGGCVLSRNLELSRSRRRCCRF